MKNLQKKKKNDSVYFLEFCSHCNIRSKTSKIRHFFARQLFSGMIFGCSLTRWYKHEIWYGGTEVVLDKTTKKIIIFESFYRINASLVINVYILYTLGPDPK